jgi:hypothetical protein
MPRYEGFYAMPRRCFRDSLPTIALISFALIALRGAVPAFAGDDIPLKNPGFEQDLLGWAADLAPGMAQHLAIETAGAAKGAKCLRVSSDEPGLNPWLAQGVAGIKPGARYSLGALARAVAGGAPVRAAVKIEFYNDRNQNTSGYYGIATPPAEGTWQPVEVVAQADADTVKAAVMVRLFGTGSVCFDEVKLTQVAAPPAMIFVPARALVTAGAPTELRFQIRLPKPWTATDLPAFTFKLSGPSLPQGQPLPPNMERAEGYFTISLKLPALQAGAYKVACSLPKWGNATFPFYVMPATQRGAGLGEKGQFLTEGKPFLALGLSHVSPGDYSVVAGAGFNAVQGLPTLDEAAVRSELDAAQAAGLKVLVPLYDPQARGADPASLVALAKSVGTHPALLGFELAAEPDLQPELAGSVAGLYLAFSDAALPQPTVLSIARPAAYTWWGRLCDVLAASPAPLPDKPLTLVAEQLDLARRALQPSQGLLAVLQAGWSPGTQPTTEQARTMAYMALATDARGLFWYSLHDVDWDLSKTALWEGFKGLNAELKALAPAVLAGPAAEKVEVGNTAVQVYAYADAEKLYLVALNLTAAPIQTRVSLPGTPVGAAQLLRTGEALTTEGAFINITLPAWGAETVVVTKGSQ